MKGQKQQENTNFLTGCIFILFFLSGAFALVYEVAWVRALTLYFGSTTLAVSTVLSVFMGGLALGAFFAGKRADKLSKPLLTYGVLEIIIAGYAMLTPFMFKWLLPLFGILAARFAESFWILSLWRFLVAVLILLPPTIMMGATLPVLSRFYVLRHPDIGRGPGLLYGVNTIGAFFGVLAAGFFFLPKIGMTATIVTIAICNLLLGGLAYQMGKKYESAPSEADIMPPDDQPEPQQSFLPMLIAVALTGCAAMICEVAWTRTLVLVLGASVYAFSIVLSTFLAGLGGGAWGVAALLRLTPAKARQVFYGLALAAAIAVCLSSASFRHLPLWFVKIFETLDIQAKSENIVWIQLLLSMVVMLIPTLIMGGLFPAAVRVIIRERQAAGQSIGKLYTFNTVGSIVGSFAAGFVMIPLLGIHNTLLAAAAVQCVGGVAGFVSGNLKKNLLAAAAGGVVVVLLFFVTPPWHKLLMTSGIYLTAKQFAEVDTSDDLQKRLTEEGELLFYRDGLSATVTVKKGLQSKSLALTINGKTDGDSFFDMPTQRLMAHFPILFHPDPQDIAIVGLGTGCTAGSAALYEQTQVTVAEIEGAVVEAARLFKNHNYAVHENPRVSIKVTDGRLLLKLHPEAYDVIISEPSNPWMAGSSDLFTKEFYQIGAKALRPSGIFLQWIHIYGISTDTLKTLVRTFSTVFPNVYIASTIAHADIVILGSFEPIDFDINRIQSRMAQPEINQDLADPRVGVNSIYELLSSFVVGPKQIRRFTGGDGPLHTDDRPIVAYKAPLDLYQYASTENMIHIQRHANGIAHLMVKNSLPASEKKQFFENLARAYNQFIPGAQAGEIAELIASDL